MCVCNSEAVLQAHFALSLKTLRKKRFHSLEKVPVRVCLHERGRDREIKRGGKNLRLCGVVLSLLHAKIMFKGVFIFR